MLDDIIIMKSALKNLVLGGLCIAWPTMGLAQETAYGDWAKQCEAGPNDQERCYLIQTVQSDSKPVMVIIVAYSQKRDRVAAMIDVPLGMHIPSGLEITTDGVSKKIEFEQCLPTGCRAILPMDDAILSTLKAGSGTVVSGRGKNGDAVELPLSGNGFEEAFGAL
jgi:invasion protein IalB